MATKGGQKTGGRKRGSLNKATREKIEKPTTLEDAQRAQEALELAKSGGRKLGRVMLSEFMHIFAGISTIYQPLPKGAKQPDGYRGENLIEFERWSKLAVQCARDLAPYESATFRAIVVAPPPNPGGARETHFTFSFFENPVIEHDAKA